MQQVGNLDPEQAVADCVAAARAPRRRCRGDRRDPACSASASAARWRSAWPPPTTPAVCVSYYGSGVPGMLDALDARDAARRCSTSAATDAVHPRRRRRRPRPRRSPAAPGFVLNVETAGHAFDNHESAMFYDEAAAKAAWAKTMAFLAEHLPVDAAVTLGHGSLTHPSHPSREPWLGDRRRSLEEAAGPSAGQRGGQAEVLARRRRGHPAARRAGDQALLDEERLVHVLDRLGLLADADGQRRQPDRAAAELLGRAASRMARSTLSRPRSSTPNSGSPSRAVASSIVPSPRTSAKSRTRRSSRLAMRGVPRDAAGDLPRAGRRRSCTPRMPAARSDDRLELVGVVVVEPGDEAEAVAQRAGDHPGAGGGADQREAAAASGGSIEAAGPLPTTMSSWKSSIAG